ncbi:Acetyltransferase (GNAT) domain-containing protein [Actinomyces ruminicola]|uniref:Acetyltransferase (GNAT) domain-containing protein n=1 Tax=Actinomyces ruminicola TaxID=332524 RepID=A0A1H0DEB1_9ACTO|nr:GNAT family N-acetyltransferase [Actinomyces ruminicola]SDN68513.1 Acetyltransferase (GNAT) domain-containing protein [Actinomyces ruminicola]
MSELTYLTGRGSVAPDQIEGMFVGWPSPPSAAQLVAVMDGSYRRVWALDGDRVVGYISAISDGVLNAFIPWLEVHPDYQGRGIGAELVRRLLAQLDDMYAVDLCCDPEMLPYYERLGFARLAGAGLRNPGALTGENTPQTLSDL